MLDGSSRSAAAFAPDLPPPAATSHSCKKPDRRELETRGLQQLYLARMAPAMARPGASAHCGIARAITINSGAARSRSVIRNDQASLPHEHNEVELTFSGCYLRSRTHAYNASAIAPHSPAAVAAPEAADSAARPLTHQPPRGTATTVCNASRDGSGSTALTTQQRQLRTAALPRTQRQGNTDLHKAIAGKSRATSVHRAERSTSTSAHGILTAKSETEAKTERAAVRYPSEESR